MFDYRKHFSPAEDKFYGMSDCNPGGDVNSGSRDSEFEPDGGQSPLSRILTALTDQRRRYICYHLADTDPSEIGECATAVAAQEVGCSPATVPEDKRQSIETSLYHTHLPKLDDLGIIDFDERTCAIRFQHPPPYFKEFLKLARRIEAQ